MGCHGIVVQVVFQDPQYRPGVEALLSVGPDQLGAGVETFLEADDVERCRQIQKRLRSMKQLFLVRHPQRGDGSPQEFRIRSMGAAVRTEHRSGFRRHTQRHPDSPCSDGSQRWPINLPLRAPSAAPISFLPRRQQRDRRQLVGRSDRGRGATNSERQHRPAPERTPETCRCSRLQLRF